MRTIGGLIIAGLFLTGRESAGAQQVIGARGPFEWSGSLAAGGLVRINDEHGDIRISAATGDHISVHGTTRRHGRRGGELVFDVVPGSRSVTICARWSDDDPCTERGARESDRDDDGGSASADLVIELPKDLAIKAMTGNGVIAIMGTGTDVEASSGNGVVTIDGAKGRVDANSGNGDVTVNNVGGPVGVNTGNGTVRVSAANGPVRAESGNGDINVRMSTLAGHESMEFTTGNGTVSVAMPANIAVDLDADTGHGSIESDFQLTVTRGRLDPGHVHASINGGGGRLRLSSGNGDLVLKKI